MKLFVSSWNSSYRTRLWDGDMFHLAFSLSRWKQLNSKQTLPGSFELTFQGRKKEEAHSSAVRPCIVTIRDRETFLPHTHDSSS
ncbi:hypothetical protein Y1Q_0003676 [Alligator mississippiensis]|uniref:Uncharacterized protein n=1 Tax=Alligator mississippiensis TaxID=8496 RepID=A0A151MSP1_ALLMI|nr:hypothetical protein Y1Q_0003676 [Alligator mississippiensis]